MVDSATCRGGSASSASTTLPCRRRRVKLTAASLTASYANRNKTLALRGGGGKSLVVSLPPEIHICGIHEGDRGELELPLRARCFITDTAGY